VVICLERRANDLHMVRPSDATATPPEGLLFWCWNKGL